MPSVHEIDLQRRTTQRRFFLLSLNLILPYLPLLLTWDMFLYLIYKPVYIYKHIYLVFYINLSN